MAASRDDPSSRRSVSSLSAVYQPNPAAGPETFRLIFRGDAGVGAVGNARPYASEIADR